MQTNQYHMGDSALSCDKMILDFAHIARNENVFYAFLTYRMRYEFWGLRNLVRILRQCY